MVLLIMEAYFVATYLLQSNVQTMLIQLEDELRKTVALYSYVGFVNNALSSICLN